MPQHNLGHSRYYPINNDILKTYFLADEIISQPKELNAQIR